MKDETNRAEVSLKQLLRGGGRSTGRTFTLVQGALVTGATLVVHTERYARQLRQQYPGLKVEAYKRPDQFLGRHNDQWVVDHYLLEELVDEMGRKYLEKIKELLRDK